MLYLLAIECSTKPLSLALLRDGVVVHEEYRGDDGLNHSQKILPILVEILDKNKIKLSDLAGIAYTNGPGGYTSLRVCLATLIGLVSSNNIPLHPVSTLKAMALGIDQETALVAPTLRASGGRVFGALYEKKNDFVQAIVDDGIFSADEFQNILAKQNRPVVRVDVSGSAVNVGRIALQDNVPQKISDIKINYLMPVEIGSPKAS